MIIERFAKNVIASGIFKFYIAAGFFTTSIFFVLNMHLFTPLEVVLGIVFVTVFFKAISNVMLSLLILLFRLDNKKAQSDFEFHSKKIDELLSELTVSDSVKKGNNAK